MAGARQNIASAAAQVRMRFIVWAPPVGLDELDQITHRQLLSPRLIVGSRCRAFKLQEACFVASPVLWNVQYSCARISPPNWRGRLPP